MRIFKTKWFVRYARHERIADAALNDAIERADRGLIDADIGGHLIKQRVARPGAGKSGGYRVIIAIRHEDRAFFLFGFAKNEQDNVEDGQLARLKRLAERWLEASDEDLAASLAEKELQELEA